MTIDVAAPTRALFTPFSGAHLQMPNRIVMAPMTRSQSPGGIPGANVAAYYRRRAENGVSLIITEGTAIDHPTAINDPNVPHFYGEAALTGWSKVLAEVHRAGGAIFPQLWHVGLVRKAGDQPFPDVAPLGPSGIAPDGTEVTQPMTERAITDIIAAYVRSAVHAQRLGFDGIELHGAHGYLIDQFFWDRTNKRTDQYGGGVVERTRFAADIVRAIRREVRADFPICLRFSQWKMGAYDARLVDSPRALEQFLAPLVDAGVDIFHCSTRRFWLPEFADSELNLAGWTKKITGRTVITVGSVGLDTDMLATFSGGAPSAHVGLEKIGEMVAKDEVDLVAVGRALIADPAWSAKVRDGQSADLQPLTMDKLKELI